MAKTIVLQKLQLGDLKYILTFAKLRENVYTNLCDKLLKLIGDDYTSIIIIQRIDEDD